MKAQKRFPAGGFLQAGRDHFRGLRKIPMTMEDWAKRLDSFVRFAELEILHDSGTVSMEMAKHHAESEFEKYRIMQDAPV